MLSDLHAHTTFCDGAHSPEEMAQAGFSRGLSTLGLSSHAPAPLDTRWHMRKDRLAEYTARVRALKSRYLERMEVLLGLEIDYLPGEQSPADACFDGLGLDYKIGAVHYIDGHRYCADDKPAQLLECLHTVFGGDERALVAEYYARVAELAAQGGFDILAHFDLVRKNNAVLDLFDEQAPWYRELAIEALRASIGRGFLLEVNTGGVARGYAKGPYPAPFLIEQAIAWRIPLCIGSDAHSAQTLAFGFDDARSLIAACGGKSFYTLGPGGARIELAV